MALSLSARLGLTRWSAGTDPLSRAQLDGDHSRLDDLAAMDLQVANLAARPAPAIRGRYCWVADIRQLFRDDGVTWHRVVETDAGGVPLLQRTLPADKVAGDLPSTYPLGLSTHVVGAAGGWPAGNLTVVTQRASDARTQQIASRAADGRMWTRTQNAAADSWGRFMEVVETLRFTSTTRPTGNLYDGMRGFETDTLGTVVWQAGNNRWIYESFQVKPYFLGRLGTAQSLSNNVFETINWTAEDYDTHAGHAAGAAGYVVPFDGAYRVQAQVGFAPDAGGIRLIHVRVDGVNLAGSSGMTAPQSSLHDGRVSTVPRRPVLTAGQVLTVQALQNTGGALNTTAGTIAAAPIFEVVWDGSV